MTYKKLSKALSIILIVGLHQLAISQCSIENLSVTILDCVTDNNAGLVLDFQSDNPSTIGYQVSTQLGFEVFQYNELPYTLIVSGNCITDYTLTVKDLSIENCEESQTVGVICCDIMCGVQLNIQDLQCVDDEGILVSMDVIISGTEEDSLDIFTNDTYISSISEFDDSPFLIPELGPVQNLVVCAQGTTCCDTLDIVSPCDCNIFNIHTAVTSCDPIMNSYFLRVDFDFTKPSSDSFTIGRTSNLLGTHSYADLPIRVGPISFDEGDHDIFIVDQVDALCFGFVPHITLDSCEAISCELTDLKATATVDCENDGEISFDIEFNTSLESDGFQIQIGNNVYGPYQYGLNSYNVGSIPNTGESQLIVQIIDQGDNSCSIDTTIQIASCVCSFDDIVLTQFCDSDSLTQIQLDFNPIGEFNDSFDITSVINTQRFSYNELPVTISGLPSENISLEISDALNPFCLMMYTEEIECILNCSITNFEVELMSCEELGIANLSFTFDYENLSNDTLALSYNGNNIGNYIVEDSTEYFAPFVDIDCELDFNSFTLAPIDDVICTAEFSMPNINCCSPCDISDVEIISTCFDDMSGSLFIDFEYDGDTTDIFDLYILGDLYGTFTYSQIPLNISISSISAGDYPYSIEFTLCSIEDTFPFNCDEECMVENIQMDTLNCSEGMFTASLNFDHTEGNDSFSLIVNEMIDGTYALDDLPLEVGPYEGDGITDYTFTISIFDIESCIGIFDFGILDCGPNAIDDLFLDSIIWTPQNNGINLKGVSSFKNYSLIDLNGRVIQTNNIYSDQILIKNDHSSHGLYFVRLQDEKGSIHTIKIIL